jgi:hypothetical protein
MTIKTPIRTVFDSNGNASGLAEFQSGEAVGPLHGGTGLFTLGSSGSVLKVNSNATGLEWSSDPLATQTYVDTAVNNLIDAAPGALDTLNELAAAIGDDANFATTITNTVNTKLAIADFSTSFDTDFNAKSTDDLSEGDNLYYTDTRANSAFDSRLSSKSTDNVSEGSTNLYFTETRSRNSISVTGDLSYNASTGVISLTTYKSADFDTDLASKSTDDVSEGSTNLYYTDTRANSAFDTRLISKTTSDLAEGNNLYYTQSRVNSAFDTRLISKTTSDLAEGNNLYYTSDRVNSAFDSRLASKSTDNVSEGSTNLYFTDARVSSYLTTNSYATETYVDTAVNNIIAGAPEALDTLNELAEALNDNENFYASIAPTARSSISASGDLSYNSSTGVMNFSLPANTATTDDAIALSIALG